MSAQPVEDLAASDIPQPRTELREYVSELLRATVFKHPWRHPEGTEKCQECRRINPSWWVPSDVWEKIMLADGRQTICPACFIRRAEFMGLGTHGAWQLYPPSSLF